MAGKRVLGFTNFQLLRRRKNRGGLIEALVADVLEQKPDHTAVTGDLVNIALPGEFEVAKLFLESMGAPADVSFVPGNHDAYVKAIIGEPERLWGGYMRGDEGLTDNDHNFPYVRLRGNIAFVGVSSAVPTGPFSASGKLGREQTERLATTLKSLDGRGLFRILMIHHPPNAFGVARVRRLTDIRRVADAILEGGAELIIHGHDHKLERTEMVGNGHRIPVMGGPSCAGGYLVYDIEGGPGAWTCRAALRSRSTDGAFKVTWTGDLI
ncbi:metallophosphatase [Agaricicola taiwanensis]|uniref:Metallophosphatase n=1 Tax=Agaricicola taiwanensis TaxID=591372 RepID=A0A8J2YF20_9RHOB|nr:metallophosphatase [Agaricicola taiwanensis]